MASSDGGFEAGYVLMSAARDLTKRPEAFTLPTIKRAITSSVKPAEALVHTSTTLIPSLLAAACGAMAHADTRIVVGFGPSRSAPGSDQWEMSVRFTLTGKQQHEVVVGLKSAHY